MLKIKDKEVLDHRNQKWIFSSENSSFGLVSNPMEPENKNKNEADISM